MSNDDLSAKKTADTNADESNTNDIADELEAEFEEEQKRKEMMERKVSDARVEGWQVKSEEGDRTIMMKPNYGSLGMHIILLILTGWFSLGLVNVAYAGWRYTQHSDKKVVRV